jgi:hypothetical protein
VCYIRAGMALSPMERRAALRVSVLGELHGEAMVFQPMAIKEISRGGVQVETAYPLQVDSLHDFRLTLGDRSLVVKGRVAHCEVSDVMSEGATYRSGVEFVEVPDHVSSAIVEFLQVLQDRQEPV